jgi:hypothetical protein
MILDGRTMTFALRQRLNQRKKAEKQFSLAMSTHLSQKQIVGTNAPTHTMKTRPFMPT